MGKLDRDSLLTDILVNSKIESIHDGKVVDLLILYLKEPISHGEFSLFHFIRISNYMTFEKRKIIMKAFITSQFSNCPLVWIFHKKRLGEK